MYRILDWYYFNFMLFVSPSPYLPFPLSPPCSLSPLSSFLSFFFSFLFPFCCKRCPWALFLIDSSAYLSACLSVRAPPGALHLFLEWVMGMHSIDWSHKSVSTTRCRKEAMRWNIMEGSKQGQIAIQLVYKMPPHRCIFPRFNITLSSGLYCQRPWGSSQFIPHHHHRSSG